jgi:sphingomyelin phosphodiesterase 2
LRLATLNVWGLPWPFAQDGPARMRAIGARLPALELDMVAFQEVWTGGARRSLLEAGRRAGLVHAWHNAATLRGGGLLVLSRTPFRDARFEAFAVRGFPHRLWHGDYHGGKGYCTLQIASGDAGFTLIDTHLHAQYAEDGSDDEHPHRLAQVVQLATAVAGIPGPVVAAGDFNMREGRPEYAVFTRLSGMHDVAAQLSRRVPTTLVNNPYRIRRVPAGEQRIDYVFTRDGDGHRVRARSVERIFDAPPADGPPGYSDHAGLLVELELEPDPAARAAWPDAEARQLAARLLAEGRARAQERREGLRVAAVTALAGAGLAWASTRRTAVSRRRLLRAGLGAGVLVALPFGLSNAALAEIAVPDEVRGYDLVAARLAALDRRGAGR